MSSSQASSGNKKSAIDRLVDDTLGASAGAAIGVGVSAVAALAIPALFAIIPLGTIGASIAGLAFQEIARKRREKPTAAVEKNP
jgi:amino acid transporter